MVRTGSAAAAATPRGGRGRRRSRWIRRGRFAVLLAVAAVLAAVGAPTTAASWNSAASNGGPTLTAKKVFPTTVDSYFLDWYDAYNGTPSSRKMSAIMYPDANNTTNADPLPTSFSTSYYEQFNYLGADLPAGQVISNVYWHFSFASNTAGDSTCSYLATWKTSNNTLIADHGSGASPI